jgi:hypothetical protein
MFFKGYNLDSTHDEVDCEIGVRGFAIVDVAAVEECL